MGFGFKVWDLAKGVLGFRIQVLRFGIWGSLGFIQTLKTPLLSGSLIETVGFKFKVVENPKPLNPVPLRVS